MSDSYEEDEPVIRRRQAPNARVYVHDRCGGSTQVSGGDYTHICDPFRPCTGTYCCTCADFAPLHEVEWADTGERISDYRRRLREETPSLLRAWRYGLGALVGAAGGAVFGLLLAIVAQTSRSSIALFPLVAALIGAIACYFIGIMVLNRKYDIDYRKMR